MENFGTPFYDFLINQGIPDFWASIIRAGALIIVLFAVASIIHIIGRRVFLKLVAQFAKRTSSKLDDILLENKVFYKITLLFPAIAFYVFDDLVLANASFLQPILMAGANIYMIAVTASVIGAILKSLEVILANTKAFEDKPLTSYRQLLSILTYSIATILIISILINKSPMYLLSALGAATAVLLLVFRDSILGFTASIQLASNDMVKVGDWVTVEKYGADGDVIEISLNTIKVRNFDKTITTVPTYAFVSNSFRNWRGMEESGGRRIKRSISIKVDSIQFAEKNLREQLTKIAILKPFIEQRQSEIDQFNSDINFSEGSPLNGRNQTNIGLFRKYIELYLESHPMVSSELTTMVRQLPPTSEGLPLEIYCFSKDKVWKNYEGIMADIFDHILAAAPYFELEIFQNPSGNDFRRLKD